MKKPLVSILIPVYNVEKYLKTCLDSVINQTLLDIEIICVNDGSTDNSAAILEEYRKLDTRIKIITKENGGLPSARNAALECAKGTYVGFVDSDDFVEKNMFQKLVETAKKDDADIVICGANILPETPRANDWLYACLSPSYCKYEKFDSEVLYSRIDTTPFLWRTLIKKELIDSNSARLDEDIIIGEDKAFQCKVFPEAKRISVIPDKLYNYYWCRPGSLMQKQVYNNMEKRVLEHSKLVSRIGKDLIEKKHLDDREKICIDFIEWSIPFIYDDFIYLSLNSKIKASTELMPMWENLHIYQCINSIPEWKKDAFEYIKQFYGEKALFPKLSIIIPIEFSSRYIDKMLKMLDEIMDENIEIIIINNGMNNESYIEVQNFLYKNKLVRLFNTPSYTSYAESLNIGVKLASGTYISFLDTHDWYQSKSRLKDWLNYAVEKNYDICASNYSLKRIPSDSCAKQYKEDNWEEIIFELDFHNFLFKNELIQESDISFKETTILTGYLFFCHAILEAQNIGYFNEDVYCLREMHHADWISTNKCEKVLEALRSLVELSIEKVIPYLHGSVFSMLNSDWLKQIIVNNTKPYCMPSWKCPNGENSQIKTVKTLFEIVQLADLEMLSKCGYTDDDCLFETLYEVIKQRHKFLSDLSNQYLGC